MEEARFRFIVSQKRGNAWSVFLFVLVFSLIMITMVDYLGRNNLGETRELVVISVGVFGQFLLFIPFLLKISRGPATLVLRPKGLSIELDKPKMLLSFDKLEVPYTAIDSYDIAQEGQPGLVFRLKDGRQGFILHPTGKNVEVFDQEVRRVITAIEQFNEVGEGEGFPFKSVYTTPMMRILAILFFIVIITMGIVLFTQSEAQLSHQILYFTVIGITFIWQVVAHWKRG